MAKQFFRDNGVEYTDIDVSSDSQAANEMVKKTGQMSVPVIIVEKDGKEEIILGFNESKLREALGLS
jgi:glutaredoxin